MGEFYGTGMAQGFRDAQQGDGTTSATSAVGGGNHLAVEAETCELQ
jgi:hypothetical protein